MELRLRLRGLRAWRRTAPFRERTLRRCGGSGALRPPPAQIALLAIAPTGAPAISSARIAFGRACMVASRYVASHTNMQPFRQVPIWRPNRRRGASIRAALDHHNHDSSKKILGISLRTDLH